MNFPNVKLIIGRLPAYRPQPQAAPAQVDVASSSQSESWFLVFISALMGFCRTATGKLLMAAFQSAVVYVCHWVLAQLQSFGEQRPTRSTANDAPPDLVTGEQASPARTASPKKASWSYLRGVSLALSELCQNGNFGGDRIPLSAILDLMRQYQSAFVPLGPHVERDVPKRLIQLANEGIVFFDPFKKYVIVPEATRQRYALRRRELLARGVDPANLSVFGAAFTKGLYTSERVTNAVVARYMGQFLHTQGRMGNRSGAALTRQESFTSIADAICPARLMPEIEVSGNNNRVDAIVRRGHSIVTDIARIIGGGPTDNSQEGTTTASGNELRRGLSILPEMSAIVRERDALEAQKNRLRTILETSD